jgi:Fe-S cluster assembly scaffold protein SufB
MKNVENVPNFYKRDNKIAEIKEKDGIILIPSSIAWDNFDWTRDYYKKKPKHGFFAWVKKEVETPINTLIEIASKDVSQDLMNLIVVDRGIEADFNSLCMSKKSVSGKHNAKAVIVLKDNALLNFNQKNIWGKDDEFNAIYEFILDKNARLNNNIVNYGTKSKFHTREDVYLVGDNSSADFRLKMVADKGSVIISESYMYGKAKSKGYLDCSGIVVDKDSRISSIPGIFCEDKNAELNHEASIGKISEEKLIYLRSRGLSEKKAIELIINSFLKA